MAEGSAPFGGRRCGGAKKNSSRQARQAHGDGILPRIHTAVSHTRAPARRKSPSEETQFFTMKKSNQILTTARSLDITHHARRHVCGTGHVHHRRAQVRVTEKTPIIIFDLVITTRGRAMHPALIHTHLVAWRRASSMQVGAGVQVGI